MHEKSRTRDDIRNREDREGIENPESGRLPSSGYEGQTGDRSGSRSSEEENVPSRDRSSDIEKSQRSGR